MAFLIITESIETTIEILESDIQLNEKVYQQTNNEIYKAKAGILRDRLNAAVRYRNFFDKKTAYEKIKHLKHKNIVKYIQKCSEITKDLKGIYFDKDRLLFRVQVTRGGKRIYLGQFDTPDDALEILKTQI